MKNIHKIPNTNTINDEGKGRIRCTTYRKINQHAKPAKPRNKLGQCTLFKFCTTSLTKNTVLDASICTPNKCGICFNTMVTANPHAKPRKTGREIKELKNSALKSAANMY